MKSRMILAVSLLTALSATAGLASAQYSRARVKPIKVNYNFEVRNGGHAPIYYRYVHTQAFPASSAFTPWTLLNKKNGFNSNLTNALLIQLSAYSNGLNPITLLFESRGAKGPRSRGPRKCFITARVVHPEMKVVVTPQNVSEYGRKTGQSMSEHRLPLDTNLTLEELNKYVIIPADKVAKYMDPRQTAEPADEPGTSSRSHEATSTATKEPAATPPTERLIETENIPSAPESPRPPESGRYTEALTTQPRERLVTIDDDDPAAPVEKPGQLARDLGLGEPLE